TKSPREWFSLGLSLIESGNVSRALPRVELDHQVRLHDDRVRHVGQRRHAQELRRHLVVVDLDVVWNIALRALDGFEYHRDLPGPLANLDYVSHLAAV